MPIFVRVDQVNREYTSKSSQEEGRRKSPHSLYAQLIEVSSGLEKEILKLEIIPWTKLFTRKSIVPDCNTLAYRKGNSTQEQNK